MADVIVIGSGAGGSVAAMAFAEAGWNTTILECGTSTVAPNPTADDVRMFTHRGSPGQFLGLVNALPKAIGGGTVHWDAKTPRFWDIDFAKRAALGPVEDSWIDDWPFTYAELAPYYDEVEHIVGVQGAVSELPYDPTLRHAPRTGDFPMPPGPPQRSSEILAAHASGTLGWRPFPVPMAANSISRDGRPACHACGDCCGFPCPSGARSGAVAPLQRALLAGARLLKGHQVTAVRHRNGKATGVDAHSAGTDIHLPCDFVVLAASAIETVRIAALSDFPDPHGLIGVAMMFHTATVGVGLATEQLPMLPGRHYTHALDDFADPTFPGAASAARAAALPYLRGGTVELGTDARGLPNDLLRGWRPTAKGGVHPGQLLVTEMHGEDLAQPANRVRLGAHRDSLGLPVAHVTYAGHRHEAAAQKFFMAQLSRLYQAAQVKAFTLLPRGRILPTDEVPTAADVPSNHHVMGGMRMSADHSRSVVDAQGMVRGLTNVSVCDGSVFPTSGAHNPTLTIMAVSLRTAAALAGRKLPS